MGNDTVKRGKKKSAHKQTDRRTHTSQSCGPWKTREMVASDCVCARAREREREREKRERDRQREREKERERERERERLPATSTRETVASLEVAAHLRLVLEPVHQGFLGRFFHIPPVCVCVCVNVCVHVRASTRAPRGVRV